MLKNKTIVVTGGSGRFGRTLKSKVDKHFLFPKKNDLNILLNNIFPSVNFKNKYTELIKKSLIIEMQENIVIINYFAKPVNKGIVIDIDGK